MGNVASYKITDIALVTDYKTDRFSMVQVLVNFLDAFDQPLQTQQFLMQILKEHVLYIGSVDKDGKMLEPEKVEIVPVDVKAVIAANIARYIPLLEEKLSKGAAVPRDVDDRVSVDKVDQHKHLEDSAALIDVKVPV